MQVKTGRGEIASHMCPVSCEQIQPTHATRWRTPGQRVYGRAPKAAPELQRSIFILGFSDF